MLEALAGFDVDFHHHPLEFVKQGELLGVVVRSGILLSVLAKFERPHLLLVRPQRWMLWKEDPLRQIQTVLRRLEGFPRSKGRCFQLSGARRPRVLLGLVLAELEVRAVLVLGV